MDFYYYRTAKSVDGCADACRISCGIAIGECDKSHGSIPRIFGSAQGKSHRAISVSNHGCCRRAGVARHEDERAVCGSKGA